MTATFLHTADWQLGKPFAGIKDPQKRARVQQERLAVLDLIAEAAREGGAQFILVAGDLFDSPSATKATVAAACSALGRMAVPVLAIPGNHDHGGPGSLWEQEFFKRECAALAPNFRLLLTADPVELEHAVIFACPLLRRAESTDPTAWLRDPDITSSSAPDKPRIVLAHGSVQGFGGDSDELRHVLCAFVKLEEEVAEHGAIVLAIHALKDECVPANHLRAAHEENLHAGLVARPRHAKHINILLTRGRNHLAFDCSFDGAKLIAHHGGAFERQRLRRLLHLLAQAAQDVIRLAFEEEDDILDHLGIFVRRTEARAGGDAALDVVVEAGAGIVARNLLRARAPGKELLHEVERGPYGACAGIRTEVAGTVLCGLLRFER